MSVDIYDFRRIGCDVLQLLGTFPTPASLDFVPSEGLVEIDHCLIECARAWGRPYGYWQEQGGAVVQNIFPIKKSESDQISSSSKKELEMHTETAFHPWLPQYVLLLCLRGDDRAGTTFVDIEELVESFSSEERELLHQPIFQTSVDSSFINSKQGDALITMPILYNNGTSIRYDRNLMTSEVDEGKDVLKKLAEVVEDLKITIYLKAGDLAVIHNWRTIHGRTPFTPRYDGRDRWLKRVLVRLALPPASEIVVDARDDVYVVNTVI